MPAARRSSKTGSSVEPQEGFGDKINRIGTSGLQSTGYGLYKVKHKTKISLIENKINARQKQFGVDYLTLIDNKAPEKNLRLCLQTALKDIGDLKDQIDESLDKIDDKKNEVKQRRNSNYGQESASLGDVELLSPRRSSMSRSPRRNSAVSTRSSRSTSPGAFLGRAPRRASAASNRSSRSQSPGKYRSAWSRSTAPKSPAAVPKKKIEKIVSRTPPRTPKKKAYTGPKLSPTPRKSKMINTIDASYLQDFDINDFDTVNGDSERNGRSRSPKKHSNGGSKIKRPQIPDEYKNANPSCWKCREYKFSGAATSISKGKDEMIQGSIAEGLKIFKANPGRYTAMIYETDMLEWDEKDQQYGLLHRMGTERWIPQGVSPKGWMTVHVNEFERLIPFKDDVLPKKYRDEYTDSMTFRGQKLVTSKNKAIMPGRGMGTGDTPGLKIIGDVDPSDIIQGSVGDCWLLSGISGVAEFDGAIKRLFRKTPNLDKMPMDKGSSATGNMYTVTLWDLKTWKEVDYVIDERLPAHENGSGQLFFAKPSEDGEMWACYLEKALAIHCGGWDKIEGGQCTHAWALLTGCREQYQMKRNPETGHWRCFAKQNPKTEVWAEHSNSPKDQAKKIWRVHWPEVGGGDHRDEEMDDDDMFDKLFAWDQENYIVAAGTYGTSDKQSTGGLVDNHAYTVIESVSNCAGTGIDLLKVRNPWGTGEIEDGEFDDDGPGWDRYPEIKKALNPVAADDGIFWVTKKEFFKFFETIYLSASNMTEFIED